MFGLIIFVYIGLVIFVYMTMMAISTRTDLLERSFSLPPASKPWGNELLHEIEPVSSTTAPGALGGVFTCCDWHVALAKGF